MPGARSSALVKICASSGAVRRLARADVAAAIGAAAMPARRASCSLATCGSTPSAISAWYSGLAANVASSSASVWSCACWAPKPALMIGCETVSARSAAFLLAIAAASPVSPVAALAAVPAVPAPSVARIGACSAANCPSNVGSVSTLAALGRNPSVAAKSCCLRRSTGLFCSSPICCTVCKPPAKPAGSSPVPPRALSASRWNGLTTPSEIAPPVSTSGSVASAPPSCMVPCPMPIAVSLTFSPSERVSFGGVASAGPSN